MNFNSVKELNNFLSGITTSRNIKTDISYVNASGKQVTVKFIGAGQFGSTKNMIWIADKDVDRVQIEYSGDDTNLSVSKVKIG